jgi:hypothetical protein
MRRLGTLVAAITLLTAAPASAETFTVTGTGDAVGGGCTGASCPTIRTALAAASNNGATTEDVIFIPANASPYQLAGADLLVNSRVIIRGGGARSTVISASTNGQLPLRRVFNVTGDQVMIESLTMANGQVGTQSGGNLVHNSGTLVLDHVRVTGGVAGNGGGIASFNVPMTIRNSLIDANQGGGIFTSSINVPGSALSITDSTIALNTLGPGIELVQDGPPSIVRLERVTVARNLGGLQMSGPGDTRVRASIVSNNTTAAAGVVDCQGGQPTSDGANVETETDCGFTGAGDQQNANAGLSAVLVNAGGQTDVLTIASGSPAMNRAGACSGTDQRDLPRPQGGACDSGAFEVDQPPDTQLVAAPPTFTFSSSEPGVRFECRLDRPTRTGTPFACSSPASFPDLPPGSYTFVVRAIDGTGNADPTAAAAAFVVQTPQPKAGRTVVVNRVRGKVLVKIPGGRFVDLSRITEIPDGSIIDTRKGVVVLVFRPRPGAKTQRAKFYDGLFKADQRGRIMELVLVEKLAKCQQQGDASAAARRKKRRLWGDGRGRFRTKGQYSSATVRGTKWLTQDSCAGTRTSVRRGKVDVRDFVRKKTIRLKKGQAYLARPNP